MSIRKTEPIVFSRTVVRQKSRFHEKNKIIKDDSCFGCCLDECVLELQLSFERISKYIPFFCEENKRNCHYGMFCYILRKHLLKCSSQVFFYKNFRLENVFSLPPSNYKSKADVKYPCCQRDTFELKRTEFFFSEYV